MDFIGSHTLFASHYVFGTALPRPVNIDTFKALAKWILFKNEDPFMNRYNTERTECIYYLHEISLSELQQILNDLGAIYKSHYPYSEKSDFVEHILGYSIFELKKIASSQFIPYGVPFNDFQYYFRYVDDSYMIQDYATPAGIMIEHYQQYARRVLELIKRFSYNFNHTPKPKRSEKLTFRFKSGNTNKLKDIISQLTLKVYFLNEDLTSIDSAVRILTSKDLRSEEEQFHIGCKTQEFRYIYDQLSPLFDNFRISLIEKSGLFFSKKGTPLKGSNLSNQRNKEPRLKAEIDKIFKQLL